MKHYSLDFFSTIQKCKTWMDEVSRGSQKVQTSSHKINKAWG